MLYTHSLAFYQTYIFWGFVKSDDFAWFPRDWALHLTFVFNYNSGKIVLEWITEKTCVNGFSLADGIPSNSFQLERNERVREQTIKRELQIKAICPCPFCLLTRVQIQNQWQFIVKIYKMLHTKWPLIIINWSFRWYLLKHLVVGWLVLKLQTFMR